MQYNIDVTVRSAQNLANRLAQFPNNRTETSRGGIWKLGVNEDQGSELKNQYSKVLSDIEEVTNIIFSDINESGREFHLVKFAEVNNFFKATRRLLQDDHVVNFSKILGVEDRHANVESLLSSSRRTLAECYHTELKTISNRLDEIHETINSLSSNGLRDILSVTKELLHIFNEGEPKSDRAFVDYRGTANLREKIITEFGTIFTKINELKMQSTASSSSDIDISEDRSASNSPEPMILPEKPDVATRRNIARLYNEFEPLIHSYRDEVLGFYSAQVFSENSLWYPVEHLVVATDVTGESSLVVDQYNKDFDRLINKTPLNLSVDDNHLEVNVRGDHLSSVETVKIIKEFLVSNGVAPSDALEVQFLLTQTSQTDTGAIIAGLTAHIADDERLENLNISQAGLVRKEFSVQFLKESNSINLVMVSEIPLEYRSEEGPPVEFAKFQTEQIIKLVGDAHKQYKPSKEESTFTYSLVKL